MAACAVHERGGRGRGVPDGQRDGRVGGGAEPVCGHVAQDFCKCVIFVVVFIFGGTLMDLCLF